jgi:hypothetical protein
MFTAALAVQVGHDRRLLSELLTSTAQKVPCLSRNNALIKHLYDDSTLWEPLSGVQLMALGHALLRFIHSHLNHLASLTANGPHSVPGILRLCQLIGRGAIEYLFLLHKPLAFAARRGLQVHGARNPLLHSREYYEAALQAFYRDVPGLMFFDYQPESSTPVLRTAIELKLREAIGIGAFREQSGRLRIISVSQIIDLRSKLQLESVVPLPHVWRIYRWTNHALHGSRRPAMCLLWFAMDYLRPFLRGARVRHNSITSNPVWSRLSDDELEKVLRTEFSIAPDAQTIGVERITGPSPHSPSLANPLKRMVGRGRRSTA